MDKAQLPAQLTNLLEQLPQQFLDVGFGQALDFSVLLFGIFGSVGIVRGCKSRKRG